MCYQNIKAHKWTATQRHVLWDNVWTKRDEMFQKLISEQDLQRSHEVWCEALEEYLHELDVKTEDNEQQRSCSHTRGTIPKFAQTVAQRHH